uniref:Chondroitin proteoglycan 4 domain-containing protein n=1 Tax=Trichuris muris TaxID=70415 RepID=A0A5S6Q7N0_TRIMR
MPFDVRQPSDDMLNKGFIFLYLTCGTAVSSAQSVHFFSEAPKALFTEAVPKLLKFVKIFLEAQRNATMEERSVNETCTDNCLFPTSDWVKGPLGPEDTQRDNETTLDDQSVGTLLETRFRDQVLSSKLAAPAKEVHQKIMHLLRQSSIGTDFNLDIAYFDQVCRMTQPTAQCVEACSSDGAKDAATAARSLVQFLCADRMHTAKTNTPCLKQLFSERGKFCLTKCRKNEFKLQESSQIFLLNKQSADMKQGVAKNVCKYTKCMAACFIPTVDKKCGVEAGSLTKEVLQKAMDIFRKVFNLVGDEALICEYQEGDEDED